ncbi:probable polyamine oxidase 5 [Aristolochia californica]|uniref:probable polyamine oxidase 5 n=1 Tax=Aristolochia californica TaxID=171875 RepID=UPI0035D63E4B
MGAKKARIVIVGAGMAGLTAANKLCTSARSGELFEVVVVEGGNRIGGRIHTSELMGDRIEMGATWIHGIGGSPVYRIAQEIGALHSTKPWERMDGFPEEPITVAEGGVLLDPSLVESISELYLNLMDFAKGKPLQADNDDGDVSGRCCRQELYDIANEAAAAATEVEDISVGSFLRRGLNAYWASRSNTGNADFCGNGSSTTWSRESLEEAIFAMDENTERTYTSAGDLFHLSFNAEREYELFPDEEITIAKGYSSVIEALASVLPPGVIRLGQKVKKIEWLQDGTKPRWPPVEADGGPVKLHFEDGYFIFADHVIVTVSLGVLKAGIREEAAGGGLFTPQLPFFKRDAISRLGFGVVNKLFLHLADEKEEDDKDEVDGKTSSSPEFPFLQLVFDQSSKSLKKGKIPLWMRSTVSVCPIYKKSRVLLSWFAGEEALELESLKEEDVSKGVSTTLAAFDATDWLLLRHRHDSHNYHNRNGVSNGIDGGSRLKFDRVLKSGWGMDPLFLGSYSYVAVGSSSDDLDSLAEPLPRASVEGQVPPLQILFAGEATDRTHYSTTHGAYLSGLREANRLLQHYCC